MSEDTSRSPAAGRLQEFSESLDTLVDLHDRAVFDGQIQPDELEQIQREFSKLQAAAPDAIGVPRLEPPALVKLVEHRETATLQPTAAVLKAAYLSHLRGYKAEVEKLRADVARTPHDRTKSGRLRKLEGMAEHVPVKVATLLALMKWPGFTTAYWFELDTPDYVRVWAYCYESPAQVFWQRNADGSLYLDQNDKRVPVGQWLAMDCKQTPTVDRYNKPIANYLEKAMTAARGRCLVQLGVSVASVVVAAAGMESEYAELMSDVLATGDLDELDTAAGAPPAHAMASDEREAALTREMQEEAQARAQGKFRKWADARADIFTLEEIEQKHGQITEMSTQKLIDIHAELSALRSREEWLGSIDLAVPIDGQVQEWRDWPGGTEQEQVLSYFDSVHDLIPSDSEELRLAVRQSQGRVALIPRDDADMGHKLQVAVDQLRLATAGVIEGIDEDLPSFDSDSGPA